MPSRTHGRSTGGPPDTPDPVMDLPGATHGQVLRSARKLAGISQAEAATRSGLRRQLISDLEMDRYQSVKLPWLKALGVAYGVHPGLLTPWHVVESLAPQTRGARTRRRRAATMTAPPAPPALRGGPIVHAEGAVDAFLAGNTASALARAS